MTRLTKFFLSYFLGLTLVAGCANNHPIAAVPNSNGAQNFYTNPNTKDFNYLGVQGYQQTEEYTCGPAIIMSLLKYYHLLSDAQMNKATEMRIATELGTTVEQGTSPQQIVAWLKAHNFNVHYSTHGSLAMLQENLAKRIPTIVEWIDWGGHWAIVTGYYRGGEKPDAGKDTIFFADPAAHFLHIHTKQGITSFNADRFNSMWFDAQYFKPGHLVRGIYIIAVPKNIKK